MTISSFLVKIEGTAAPRGQSLGKSSVVSSVEYSRTLLRCRFDLSSTLPHDLSAVWSGRFYKLKN